MEPQVQIHHIIKPECHLNSPVVEKKLTLLWKLTGLPLPSDLDGCVAHKDVTWEDVQQSEVHLMKELRLLVRRMSSSLHAKGEFIDTYRPICHPRTLSWLTCISLSKSDAILESHKKMLTRVGGMIRCPAEQLFLLLGKKLAGDPCLFHQLQHLPNCPINARFEQQDFGERLWSPTTDSSRVTGGEYSSCVYAWYLIRQTMRYMVLQRKQAQLQTPHSLLYGSSILIGVHPDLVIIMNLKTKVFTCLTFDMVLMYTDVTEGRAMTKLIASSEPTMLEVIHRVEGLWLLIDSVFEEIGGAGYNVVASLESLAYGSVQLWDKSPEHAGEFFSFNLKEIRSELENYLDPSMSHRVVEQIRLLYTGLSVNQAGEMLCILRHWGHPLLCATKAAKKVRESMCAPKLTSLDTTLKVLAFFIADIINGHRRSHSGLWPNIKPESLVSPLVQSLHRESAEIQYTVALKHYKEISLIEFQKSIDYDLVEDLSVFLKDKAICRPKSNWLSVFRKSLLPGHLKDKLQTEGPSNRLLLDFLQSSEFDPVREFEYVTSLNYLSDPEFCASYSLKEREVKTDGRIFAKMTRKMRNCQVLLESLLACHVCDYFKENGVVQEQISLTKSLLAMSQLAPRVSEYQGRVLRSTDRCDRPGTEHGAARGLNGENKRRKTIIASFLTTDLQKYCLNWRYTVIKPFAQRLNQLFGIAHGFEWIHLRLMNTTMFVGDPHNVPQFSTNKDLNSQENDGIFIVSPRGGIEGLCQKMWTMISIAAIHLAATESGCRVASMVQGDNQAIAITTEIEEGEDAETASTRLNTISKRFFNTFREINRGIGHNLKVQETIHSESFFVYSKRIFFEGKILSQLLKNASRLVLVSETVGENCVGNCSNIGSTIARLIENGLDKRVAWGLNVLMVVKQILFDIDFSLEPEPSKGLIHSIRHDPNNLKNISVTPAQLGGLNFLALSRLFTRNIGDPVSSAMADMKFYTQVELTPPHLLRNAIFREPGDGSWTTLCADPYSLNQPYVQLPTSYLKKHTQRMLLSASTNPLLQGTRVENQYKEEEELAKFLLDREFVMPRVAHTVFETTVAGRRKHLQGLIDTTPTIIKYALHHHPISFKKSMLISSYTADYIMSFIDTIATVEYPKRDIMRLWERGMINATTCAVTLADYARTYSWWGILGGRSIKGVTTPDTLELCSGSLIEQGNPCSQCVMGDESFSWFFLPGNIDIERPDHSRVAQRIAYVGSKTEERRAASLTTIKGMSTHLRAALRGASVYIWAYGDSEKNWKDAASLANTRCVISEEHLRALCPIPSSANIQHRLMDGISVTKFTPASLARVSSYVHISNDRHQNKIDGQVIESNVIFQQVMLLGLGIFETFHPLFHRYINSPMTLHLHTGYSCCIREADNGDFLETTVDVPSMTITTSNKFLFDPEPIQGDDEAKLHVSSFKYCEMGLEVLDPPGLVALLSLVTARISIDTSIGESAYNSIHNDAIVSFDNSINWISEYMYCDLRLLAVAMAREFCDNLSYQLYYLRVKGRHAIRDYLKQALSRIPGLQLANIALTISHPGVWARLRLIGAVSAGSSPISATVNYSAAVCELILWGYDQYTAQLLEGYEPEIIVPNYKDDDLNRKVEHILARRACLLSLLCEYPGKYPNIKDLEPIEKCTALSDLNKLWTATDQRTRECFSGISQILDAPKLNPFITNLFFLSRKLLNAIRGSTDCKAYVENLYEDIDIELTSLTEVVPLGEDDQMITGQLRYDIELKELTPNFTVTWCCFDSTTALKSRCVNHATEGAERYIRRTVGTASTSWYKAAGVLTIPGFLNLPNGNGLYLAESSGAIMTVMEHLVCSKKIWYNTLFSNELNPPQRNFGPNPIQFEESIVGKHITAGIPCKAGHVQEFETLWREVDEETDLTSMKCVNFIVSRVDQHSCHIVCCDLELALGTPLEVAQSAYTHVIALALHSLMIGGKLVLKMYFTQNALLHHVLSLLLVLPFHITIHTNGYCSQRGSEGFLIATRTGIALSSNVSQILSNVTEMIRKGQTLVPVKVLSTISNGFKRVSGALDELRRELYLPSCHIPQSATDMFLIQIGGKIQSDWMTGARNCLVGDTDPVLYDIVAILSTLLKEIIHVRESRESVDKVLLLGAYNLQVSGKIRTMAMAATRSVLHLHITRIVGNAVSNIRRLLPLLDKGFIVISDMYSVKDFLKKTDSPKYFLNKLGRSEISQIFDIESKMILSRAEIKGILKLIGTVAKQHSE
uniref:RNA-directed RNA polymerase L n=1 Tax=avian paramyxovirus 6 TaxID=2560316 RepID=A0A8E5J7R5_9MONO|nr:large polymerase protein [Avian metaavulavirus 6]